MFTNFNLIITCLHILKVQNFMRKKKFVSCLIRLRDFFQEVIFYTQFSIIFLSWLNICFKIIGSNHTLNIIAICKTILTTGPIYRTYCGVYLLSPDFKYFYVFFSLVYHFLSPKFTFLCLFYTSLLLFVT